MIPRVGPFVGRTRCTHAACEAFEPLPAAERVQGRGEGC
jgi:hypothetical protein